jgi:hypothetical protein
MVKNGGGKVKKEANASQKRQKDRPNERSIQRKRR